MRRVLTFVLFGAAVFALGLAAGARQATRPGGFTELRRAPVAGSADSEAVMGLIEREGESTTPKHYHPGGEFGFVLDGVVLIEAEGRGTTTLRPGDTFYQPPGEWHIVTSGATGAKTIVFRLLAKGQAAVVTIE